MAAEGGEKEPVLPCCFVQDKGKGEKKKRGEKCPHRNFCLSKAPEVSFSGKSKWDETCFSLGNTAAWPNKRSLLLSLPASKPATSGLMLLYQQPSHFQLRPEDAAPQNSQGPLEEKVPLLQEKRKQSPAKNPAAAAEGFAGDLLLCSCQF